MGSEDGTSPKLSMLSWRATREPEMSTPPLHAAVSVPFKWEEAPGKPRHRPAGLKAKSARTLELPRPPRLVFSSEAKVSNVASPTTVLEGPYMARTMSLTSSNRMSSSGGKAYWDGGFGRSCRWTGFMRNREEEGSSDFSSSAGDGRRMSRRRGSFFGNISNSSSHLWASIRDGLRQVVPRRRKQDDGHISN